MGYPIKHLFWALLGGMLSAALSIKTGWTFWLASIVVFALILLCDYIVHMWRMWFFTLAIIANFEDVSAFVKLQGASLMVGTKEELNHNYGVAYKLPKNDDYLFGQKDRYFCISDAQEEKRIMANYNRFRRKNTIYRILEFLF